MAAEYTKRGKGRSEESSLEAIAIIQVRQDGGLDQVHSMLLPGWKRSVPGNRCGELWSETGCIWKEKAESLPD